jgi:flagellar motor switch protein FliN/FliY
VSSLDSVKVEISVVIGRAKMPIQQLLRMGRGAVIELDAGSEDDVWIYANNRLVARGEIQVVGDTVCVAVTEMLSVLTQE